MKEKLLDLHIQVVGILMEAPDEEDCTKEENDLFAELQNTKEAIENFLEKL